MASNKCAGIARPQLDESPVPCEQYMSSDCVYTSDKAEMSWLGVPEGDSMTNLLNALLEEIRSPRSRMEKLESKINYI